MAQKRALIVDDSRSARLFLARILEKHGIEVDSVESAEAAIGYLTSKRPDVIFMDHMMPGMDGLQAVRAIKNDPRTATIPIMMYTSQEGEVYLGQARALGAVGVMPKQIKHADVSKVLYQLHLVTDRRSDEQTSFRPVEVEALLPSAAHGSSSLAIARGEHDAADGQQPLRRWLQASLDAQAERISADIRGLLPPQGGRGSGWIAGLAIAACAAALVATGFWWGEHTRLQAATAELTLLRQAVASRQAAAPPAPTAAFTVGAQSTPAPMPKPLVLAVPYGSDALGGSRLGVIREMLARLVADHASGLVQIRTFAGRFCLKGDPVNGYALAPDKMPFAQCDVVGNPADDALPPAQRMPLALANLIAETRASTHGALDVETSVGDPGTNRIPYPAATDDLTAGEWNRAGKANNRVEILMR